MRIHQKLAFTLLILSVLTGCQTVEQHRSIVNFNISGVSKPVGKGFEGDYPLRLKGEISVSAIGDIIPHSNVKKCAQMHNIVENGISRNNEGYDYLFERVRDSLRADITIANYESPIAPSSANQGQPFVFNSTVSLLRASMKGNINVFNIANNHIYDQGLEGFKETLEVLKKENASYIGTYRDDIPIPLILDKKGIKVAIFGFTTLLNNQPDYSGTSEYVRRLDLSKDLRYIQKAKAEADIVIVYIHWGEEYKKEPDRSQTDIAEALIDAGADIIIGGHPHILQSLYLIPSRDQRVVPVVFSMGNFISNQSRNYSYPISQVDEGRTRDSAILRFSLRRYSFGGLNFTTVADLYFIPVWTINNNLFYSKGLESTLEIYPVLIDEEIERLWERLRDEKDEKRAFRLIQEIENLNKRKAVIKGTLGEDYFR